MKRVRTPLLAAFTIGALAAAGIAGTAPGAQASGHGNGHHAVPHTKPGWVQDTKAIGAAPAQGRSHFRVYLQPRGGIDALKAKVLSVSTPGTADYHHFLTPAQYQASYAPTQATVTKVRSFLAASHLKVTQVEADRRYVEVSGSNANVSKAFGTAIKKFHHQGQTVQANTSAVKVPTTVASSFLAVTGLDTTQNKIKHFASSPFPPPAGFVNARPCSRYYGQVAATYQADYKTPLPKFMNKVLPYAVCGYTGPQYRAAYQGANPNKLDGTGVTIGVLDAYASPNLASDAQTYATNHGDGSFTKGQYTEQTPAKYTHGDADPQTGCDAPGWYGEQALDVEAEHAMAPGANIVYYGATSCYDQDFLAAMAKVVKQNKVQILSNSWGEVEEAEDANSIAAYEQVFLQGALQGITFTFSSGDNGDELANSAIKQADYPTSDPYVTSVGGTADAIGPDGSLQWQAGWGTEKYSLNAAKNGWTPLGYLYGAGGGVSSLFNQPAYQKGIVPPQFANGRAVPDVAMDADPTTGMLVGFTQKFTDGTRYSEYRIGGTSLASPLFAGNAALLLQKNGGGGVGLMNPLLYGQLRSSMNDVSAAPPDAGNVRIDYTNSESPAGGYTYSVRTFNQDSSLTTAKGWDEVTGVGSPTSSFIDTVIK